MAHQIEMMNGQAQMAFVGQTPWHGLGQRVSIGADIETWRRQSGLDYDVLSAPVMYAFAGQIKELEEKRVFYRSTDGHPLAVNSAAYCVHQPKEILEFFRRLAESVGAQIHTAGAIDGGRVIWAMAKMPDLTGSIVEGDGMRVNLVLATSVDGSMRTTAFMTAIRIVCANTLRLALGRAGLKVAQSHRSGFDGERLEADLSTADSEFRGLLENARALTEKRVSKADAQDIVRELLAGERWSQYKAEAAKAQNTGATDADRLGLPTFKAPRGEARILELFAGAGRGATHHGSAGTAWGLLNAVTEYVDHERGNAADSRLTSAWFGEGNALKDQTFERLLAL